MPARAATCRNEAPSWVTAWAIASSSADCTVSRARVNEVTAEVDEVRSTSLSTLTASE